MFRWDAELLRHRQLIGAPAGIRTQNQQIMRRFEGHQQGETKPDEAVFTESAAVKVRYVLLRLSTPSRHNRAIRDSVSVEKDFKESRATITAYQVLSQATIFPFFRWLAFYNARTYFGIING